MTTPRLTRKDWETLTLPVLAERLLELMRELDDETERKQQGTLAQGTITARG